MRTYIKARRKYRRAQLIELLGGKCVRCGSTDELEFDHINPETKVFAVGSDMSRAWATLVEEALKCQLLCRPCHIAKGREDRPEPEHSYYRYWYYGCRCPICTKANAEKGRRYHGRSSRREAAPGMVTDVTAIQKREFSVTAQPSTLADHPLTRASLPRCDSNTQPAG